MLFVIRLQFPYYLGELRGCRLQLLQDHSCECLYVRMGVGVRA